MGKKEITKVKITFKANPVNINGVFRDDHIVTKSVGRDFHEADFDFRNNIRILVYKCKSNKLLNQTIEGIKAITTIQGIRWKQYVV